MSIKSKISVEAFIDQGFPEGKTFCTQFLYVLRKSQAAAILKWRGHNVARLAG